MKNKWIVRGDTMEGFDCVSLVSKDVSTGLVSIERCLSGAGGELWEQAEGAYKAILFLPGGGEKIKSFKSKDFLSVKKGCRIPFRASDQLRYANSFHKGF